MTMPPTRCRVTPPRVMRRRYYQEVKTLQACVLFGFLINNQSQFESLTEKLRFED